MFNITAKEKEMILSYRIFSAKKDTKNNRKRIIKLSDKVHNTIEQKRNTDDKKAKLALTEKIKKLKIKLNNEKIKYKKVKQFNKKEENKNLTEKVNKRRKQNRNLSK